MCESAKTFILGLFLGIALGSIMTYVITDYYWPTVKIKVQSGPNGKV